MRLRSLPSPLALALSAATLAGCAAPSEEVDVQQAPLTRATGRTAEILRARGGTPCAKRPDFTCVKLAMPLDHFGDKARKLDVVFGVKPATGERKGTFVIVHGGPGSSGIDRLDDYASVDPRLAEHFDVVHFDLRSVGLSGGLACPRASLGWATHGPIGNAASEADLSARAKAFADACVTEMGVAAADLPFYSTKQAVEDLDVFRSVFEEEKLYVYGMSYGTQYGQFYGRAHPDRLAALVVDGVVDTTLTLNGYGASVVRRQNAMLDDVLDECTANAACKAAVGGDAKVVYDALRTKLAGDGKTTDWKKDGAIEKRTVDAADLDFAVSGMLRDPSARRRVSRLLADVAGGDLAPILRAVYARRGIAADSLTPEPSTESSAGYYVITCNDYALGTETGARTPEEAARAYLASGRALAAEGLRLKTAFYYDLPCAFWPKGEAQPSRPKPLKLEGVPALVVTAKGDSTTPVTQGLSVFEAFADGYALVEESGQHVSYGYGKRCTDQLVSDFIVLGKRPQKKTVCPGRFVDPWY